MRIRSGILFLASFHCLPLSAAVDGFTKVKSSGGVTEYRMEANGLTVLLAPMEQVPAATFSITYRVGSRNESYGTTGSAHLLEHMMFKGTAKHNKEAGNGIDQTLEGIGASTNATTSWDRTNYATTLPVEHLPVIIGLEADRMRNLRLREVDLRPEMQVVMDEFFLAEDDPISALDREIWATAFQAHPYHHSVLGWRSDVETVPISNLREFYDAYYWPDNATVTVTGGFHDEDTILHEIKNRFGAIPKAPKAIPAVRSKEPIQTGLRRFEMKRAVESEVVTIAFKSPDVRHPDFPALMVLCDILADGQNSHFYEKLTETGLALDTTAAPMPTVDPSLLLITSELAENATHEKTEQGIRNILQEVIEKGADEAEVGIAKTRLLAQARFDRDGTAAVDEVLTESIAAGDWTLYQTLEEDLKKVTAGDVQRVAKEWLRVDRSTVGWLVPDESAPAAKSAPAPEVAATGIAPLILPELPPAADPAVSKVAPRVIRATVAGLDLVVCPSGHNGVIHLTGSLPVGSTADQPLASFVAEMIERGTLQHDAAEIGELLDETGSTLEFDVRDGFLHFTGRCFAEHLPRLLSVLAEQLREPSFPDKEVGLIRDQLLSEIALSRSNAAEQAALAFNRALHPAGNPDRLPDADEVASKIKSVSRDDLVAFHKQWFGPAAAAVVIAGDVEPGECRGLVEKSFAGWTGGQPVPTGSPITAPTAPLVLKVPLPGKESVQVLLGQPCLLSPGDEDTLALSLASAALGDGFTSRLVHTVRDTEGLTYGVRCLLSTKERGDSTWLITASFSPDLQERGIRAIRREFDRWYRDGITEAEFLYRKSAMAGASRVELATSSGLATALHDCIRRGLPLEWIDEYPARIGALNREKVNAAIRKYVPPERLLEVKCGDLR